MPIGTEQQFAWQPIPETASKESCTMQAIISGVVGGGAGLVLGAILAPFNSNISNMETDNLPMKEQFRRGLREMGSQSKSWGKNLMVIGAVFSCSECFVEKTRARTDRWNPIFGGCITGGILAANGDCPPRTPCRRAALTARSLVLSCSWAAGDGDRLRGVRRLLRCDRRDGLRPF